MADNIKRPDAVSKFETILLDRVLYQATQRFNMEWLHRADVDTHYDFMRDQLIVRLRAEIAQHKIGEDRVVIKEAPIYETPRHAFLSTLPEGSFRRRFLSYWWEIDPNEPLEQTQREHVITMKQWINYPDFAIPIGGRPVPIQVMKHETSPYWEAEE